MSQQLPNLAELSHSEKDHLIQRFFDELTALRIEVNQLKEENKELRGKLAENSPNSSQPPSSDGYQKPQPKSLRKPSGKKTGGQQGHSGSRLEMVAQPDHVVPHTVDECDRCGRSLESVEATDVRCRQESYFKFSCDHSLCNTHHLRELTCLAEQDQQDWAEKLIKLLLEAKGLVEGTLENCLAKESAELASIYLRYDAILAEGFSQDRPPPIQTGKKKRGRPKQSKSKNMLDRLRDFKTEVLAFMTHPLIPFDNNQGERDVRHPVQIKTGSDFGAIP